MPFVKDVLPSITKLASLALSDSDKIADVIQKAQLIKSLPKEEKSKEVKELISIARPQEIGTISTFNSFIFYIIRSVFFRNY